jgi:hypothetical protein
MEQILQIPIVTEKYNLMKLLKIKAVSSKKYTIK